MTRKYIATHKINYVDKLDICIHGASAYIAYLDECNRPYRLFTILYNTKVIVLDESNGVIRCEMKYEQAYACYRQLFADLKSCGYTVRIYTKNGTTRLTVNIDGRTYSRTL